MPDSLISTAIVTTQGGVVVKVRIPRNAQYRTPEIVFNNISLQTATLTANAIQNSAATSVERQALARHYELLIQPALTFDGKFLPSSMKVNGVTYQEPLESIFNDNRLFTKRVDGGTILGVGSADGVELSLPLFPSYGTDIDLSRFDLSYNKNADTDARFLGFKDAASAMASTILHEMGHYYVVEWSDRMGGHGEVYKDVYHVPGAYNGTDKYDVLGDDVIREFQVTGSIAAGLFLDGSGLQTFLDRRAGTYETIGGGAALKGLAGSADKLGRKIFGHGTRAGPQWEIVNIYKDDRGGVAKFLKQVGKEISEVIPFSQLGAIFGSTLGRQLAGTDQLRQQVYSIGLSSVLNELGKQLDAAVGNPIPVSQATNVAVISGLQTNSALLNDLTNGGVGAISSYLTAELVKSLGAHGVVGGALNSAGGAAIQQIVTNIANLGAPILNANGVVTGNVRVFTNVNVPTIGSAAGGFIGSTLAAQLVSFDTIGGQIGASVGSAIAGYVVAGIFTNAATAALAAGAAASSFGSIALSLGSLAGPVGAAVGAFVGFVLGGVVGSLFGGTPRSGADVIWNADTQNFVMANAWSRKTGSIDAAKSLAGTAAGTFNGVLASIGGKLLDATHVQAGSYGLVKKDYVYRPVGGGSGKGAVTASFSGSTASTDLLNLGEYHGFYDIVSRLAGGDIYAKRALAATLLAANGQAGDGKASSGSFDASVLAGNIVTAKDYAQYLTNRSVIDALISADRQSAFSLAYLVTFQRARDLALDKRNATDWIGGWNAWLDEQADGAIDGSMLGVAQVNASYDAAFKQRTYVVSDSESYPLSTIGDLIDAASKTIIAGTSGDDTVTAVGDVLTTLPAGLTIDGLASAAGTSSYQIKVAAVIDGGAGNDTVRGGDLGNDLIGGDGTDTLIGGKLDDWLFGGAGNDILFAGNVANASFLFYDAAATQAALGTDGGSGNMLSGGDGNDRLYGGIGSDWLVGGVGGDDLYGGAGGDILDGGVGGSNGKEPLGDQSRGGAGSDQYIYRSGDGVDTILDDASDGAVAGVTGDSLSTRLVGLDGNTVAKNWAGGGDYSVDGNVKGGEDAISFGAGIKLSDLVLQRSGSTTAPGSDLIIRLQTPGTNTWNGTDQLTISDWFESTRRVEWLRFANGDEIRIGDITSYKLGSAGADVLVGTQGADFLYGLDGNDQLYGLGGNDFGFGGLGDDLVSGDGNNDFVAGGAGADTVLGGAGDDAVFGDDGNDYVAGSDGRDKVVGGIGDDRIVTGAGDDIVKFSRGDGRDTVFDELAGTWSVVWLNGAYTNGFTQDPTTKVVKNAAGRVVFDGVRYLGNYTYDDATKTLSVYNEPASGSLQAKNAGSDTIEFGVGIDIQDVELRAVGSDLQLAVLAGQGAGAANFDAVADRITIKDYYSIDVTAKRNIENFSFVSTGTIKTDTTLGTAVSATDGNDNLLGGSGKDWITGNAGDDAIDGGAADDILNGNTGNDALKGGAGNDVLYGGDGFNTLDGGAGADVLIGGSGQDAASHASATAAVKAYLDFAAANIGDALGDTYFSIENLTGGAYNDTLGGDGFDNVLAGGGGADRLLGGAGNDTYVISGAGASTIVDQPYTITGTGASAVENLLAGDGGADVLEIDNGTSLIRLGFAFSGTNAADLSITVTDALGTATSVVKDWTALAHRVETLQLLDGLAVDLSGLVLASGAGTYGTAANNFIFSKTALTAANGGDGDDVIVAGAGSTLAGGNGADTFEAGTGTRFDGGTGSDTVRYLAAGSAANVNLATGSGGTTGGAAGDAYVGIENVRGSDGFGDTLTGDGNANQLFGMGGDDAIDGGAGDDLLDGGVGIDTIYGRAGDDNIAGGDGADTLYGNEGNDVVDAGSGGGAAYGGIGNDVILGGSGNDTLYGDDLTDGGNGGTDLINAGDGNDLLLGGSGDDRAVRDATTGAVTLNGGLFGGAGDDSIYGGAGNDELSGGAGNDLLSGDLGNDTYFFDAVSGTDTVIDAAGVNNLVFGVDADGLWLARAGNDLKITVTGGGAAVTVKDFYAATSPGLVRTVTANDRTIYLQYARATGGLIDQMTALGASRPIAIPAALQALSDDLWVQGGKATPKVSDQNLFTSEDVALSGNVGAVDYDGNITSYTLVRQATRGAVTLNAATGAWTYQPAANYHSDATHPDDSFQVQTTDADGNTAVQTVTVAIASVNDRPTDVVLTASGAVIAEADHPQAPATTPLIVLGTLAGVDAADTGFADSSDFASFAYTVSDARFDVGIDANGKPVLRIKAGTVFDYEATKTVTVSVTATDRNGGTGGLGVTKAFNFGITDRDDYINGNGVLTTLTGDVGRDIIAGTSIAERIVGLAGNDTISGAGGADNVSAGDGDDQVSGGTGNDVLAGDAGIDRITGDEGDDSISGGIGNDLLYGGSNNAAIASGSDLIYGDVGDDQLFGEDSNDTLVGGAGADRLDGGAGIDTASYAEQSSGLAAAASVTANLTNAAANTGLALGDTYFGVENLTGTGFADTLTGDAGANALTSLGGADFLNGLAGNDVLDGGAGVDSLDGGDGNDTLFGGSENDSLSGGSGDDALDGQTENDTLSGGGGADALTGGKGDDLLIGGAGDDTYVIRRYDGADVVDQTGALAADNDRIGFQAGAVAAETAVAITNRDLWFTKSGNDVVISVLGAGGVSNSVRLLNFTTNDADGIANIRAVIAGQMQTKALAVNGIVQLMADVVAAGRAAPTTQAQFDALYGDSALVLAGQTFKTRWDLFWTDNAPPTIGGPSSQALTEASGAGTAQSVSFAIADDNTTLATQAPKLRLVNGNNSTVLSSDTSVIASIGAASVIGSGTSGTATFSYNLANYGSGTAWLWMHVDDVGLAAGQDKWVQVTVSPVANAPTLSATPASGNAGAAGIALNIQGALTDTDGSEAITSYRIDGVPSGISFGGAGTNLGSGSWTFAPSEVASLKAYAPIGYATDLALQVSATSTEAATGQSATSVPVALSITINAAPTLISPTAALIVPENLGTSVYVGQFATTDPDGNAVTYRLSDDTGGNFGISVDGALYYSGARSYNFEGDASPTIKVVATEVGTPVPLSIEQPFLISIGDVNEAATFTALGGYSVAENSAVGTSVGTVAASDPDGGAAGTRLYYFENGFTTSNDGRYAIDTNTGGITVNAALNFEGIGAAATPYNVMVTDASGARISTPGAISIRVDDVGEAPTMNAAAYSFAIGEELFSAYGSGTGYVGTVAASDPDANSTLNYSIVGGTGMGLFEIGSSGAIYNTARIDYESAAQSHSYTLQVVAKDGGGTGLQSAASTVTVAINPMNEAPKPSVSFYSQSGGTGNVTRTFRVNFNDPDDLSGFTGQASPYSINVSYFTQRANYSNGFVTVQQTQNYPPTPYNGWYRVSDVTLDVFDSAGLKGSVTFDPAGYGTAPVVLDLDGNGVDLISVNKSSVKIDVDWDGVADRVGWAGPNDGILALDRNGDGSIQAFDEISFVQDKQGAVSDLEGLAAFDTNLNGMFDAADADFSRFQVWQDRNSDGVSQAGELTTLAERNIAAIDLREKYTGQTPLGAKDNVLYGTSSYIRTDGTSGIAGDVMFASILSGDSRGKVAPVTNPGKAGRSAIDEAAAADTAPATATITGDAGQLSTIDARAAAARAERAAATVSGPLEKEPSTATAAASPSETPTRSMAARSAPPTEAPDDTDVKSGASAPPTGDIHSSVRAEQAEPTRLATGNAPAAAAEDAPASQTEATVVRDFGDPSGIRSDAPARQRFSNSTGSLASLIERFSADALSKSSATAFAGQRTLASPSPDANLAKLLEQMAAFHGGAGLAEDLAQRGAARAGDFASLVAAGRGAESVATWR